MKHYESENQAAADYTERRGLTKNPDDAREIFRRFDALAERRAPFEPLWRELADYVLPREVGRGVKVFDSTAPLALERFAAALESVLTPRSARWHSLALPKQDGKPEMAKQLEGLCDALFQARYRPEAQFANQIHEVYLSLGAFGSAVLFVDEQPGRGPIYRCRELSEFYFGEDQYGRVDTVMRRYELTARQAALEFGNDLPERVRRAAADPAQMERSFEFLHAVTPNPDPAARRLDFRGMSFFSRHLLCEGRELVRVGGYRSLPYIVTRYQTVPGEIYGRGPAVTVLADIKQVNEMEKTLMRAGQKLVDPPLLLADDDVLAGFSLRAGALNFGGLSEEGRPRVIPLEGGAKLSVGFEMLEQKRKVIQDAFLLNLFQVLVETPQMTATEVLQKAQEKGALLGPAIGRQQSELLAPIIRRELDILGGQGLIPQGLGGARGLDIQYDSALARAQRGESALSIVRSVQSLAPLAQYDPRVLKLIDLPEAARLVALAGGVPQSLLLSPRELEPSKEDAPGPADPAAGLASLAGQAPDLSALAGQMPDISALAGQMPAMLQSLGLGAAPTDQTAAPGGLAQTISGLSSPEIMRQEGN